MPDVGVYIPQVGLTYAELLERARRCERLGFGSMWLFDHLYAPGLPDQAALEGWTLATALLASTSSLRIGHLVLDNNLRHPALLGRMATTLAQVSGGRFELGLGSGSYAPEHDQGGFPWGDAAERTARLAESLAILELMFTGEPADFAGDHYRLRGMPNPGGGGARPRIHLGGVGIRHTIPLVARHADVWNIPTYGLARRARAAEELDRACERIGRDPAAIVRSLEAVVVIAEDDRRLAEAVTRAERRYRGEAWGLEAGGFVGTPPQVADRLRAVEAEGFELVVLFPADRGAGGMLELMAEQVLPCT